MELIILCFINILHQILCIYLVTYVNDIVITSNDQDAKAEYSYHVQWSSVLEEYETVWLLDPMQKQNIE